MNKIKRCENCGAKMIEYKHSFNKALAKGLVILFKKGGKAKFSELEGLTFNQKNNFQKIKYWGLIESVPDSSEWKITNEGYGFLENKVMIPKRIITYRNVVVGEDGGYISILDAFEDHSYWYRETYLKESTNKKD